MTKMIDQSGGNKVDQTLTVIPGGWQFDETVAHHFDSHVRKSIPQYDAVQQLCADVSEWFVTEGCLIYDLGCATGETMLQVAKKFQEKRSIRLVGIDESAAMLQQAQQKLAGHQATFLEQRLSPETRFQGATFVAALYTLQFVFLEERLKILSNIYSDLKTGGALFLVEKCLSEQPQIQDIWSGLYYDFKANQGFSHDEIIGKTLSLRGVMTPITASENERALRGAGFGAVDRITQWGPFIAFLAVKTKTAAAGHGNGSGDGARPQSDLIQ
jgi:tRNA (cmo5U34)-methyltransferase